jgi:hypothetical protein
VLKNSLHAYELPTRDSNPGTSVFTKEFGTLSVAESGSRCYAFGRSFLLEIDPSISQEHELLDHTTSFMATKSFDLPSPSSIPHKRAFNLSSPVSRQLFLHIAYTPDSTSSDNPQLILPKSHTHRNSLSTSNTDRSQGESIDRIDYINSITSTRK